MKREWIIGAVSLLAWAVPITGQPANPPAGSPADLTVQETIEKVLIHNESLQAKMLDAEIARRQYKAEKGIFEPAVVGSYDRVYNHRENTFEQRAALGGQPEFAEDNNLFNGGLEVLSPLGGKFRLGYDLRRLKNSLNVSIGHEYVSAVGATLTQPLLKNGGIPATMARIRLAAITSDIAYQDYRRQLMLTLSKAESAYWDLYFSQEQESISRESLEIAQALFKDNEERVKVGKSSQLEVLEAEAGVSLRRARRSEAGQRLTEAASQLSILTSGSSTGTNIAVHATEEPKMIEVPLDFYEGYRTAYEKNPDYLTRKAQALAENIRLAYTKNQSLPQLDLKGSYGLNGLGQSVGDSYDDINRADFASWSVGLELRIPITGGIRERNELKAAQLSKQKALVGLKEIEVQMGNALSTAILKVNNLRDSVQDHRSVISFHQQLLETQLARLEVGVIDSKTVLETEDKLFDARMALLENLVAYQKALLELELVKGTTLVSRNVEMTKAQLQDLTEKLLAANRFSGPEIQAIRWEVDEQYKERIKDLDMHEKPQTLRQRIFN